ncbi:hypothetical protein C9374_006440 [Naegleria lovaniensis]|uniref:Uncharacterized protein n=1 Tax=Naegleria lovaniensis TaxID=51637 RepID=A0AA88GI87_NAELO|nr:uncharacterized protein C9374_006440 [Naegleria lovaniensis]KAG2381451.1 hypothetical protein C9374_006440 [Naegleria lovaniensis]
MLKHYYKRTLASSSLSHQKLLAEYFKRNIIDSGSTIGSRFIPMTELTHFPIMQLKYSGFVSLGMSYHTHRNQHQQQRTYRSTSFHHRNEYRKTLVKYALMLSLTLPIILMLGSKYLLIHLTQEEMQLWNSIIKPIDSIDQIFYNEETTTEKAINEERTTEMAATMDEGPLHRLMKTTVVDHNIYEFTSENIRNKILDMISESIQKVKQTCDFFELDDVESLKSKIKTIAIDKRQTRSLIVWRGETNNDEVKKDFKLFNTKGILFIHAPVMTSKGVVFIRTGVQVSDMNNMTMHPYRIDVCQVEVKHYDRNTPEDKTPTRVVFNRGFRDEEDDTSILPVSYEQLSVLFEEYSYIKCAKIPTPNHVIEISSIEKPVTTNAYGYEFSDSYESGNQLKLVRVTK